MQEHTSPTLSHEIRILALSSSLSPIKINWTHLHHFGPFKIKTRPSALGMSDPGVEPLEILKILELETPPYPRPPCRCPPFTKHMI